MINFNPQPPPLDSPHENITVNNVICMIPSENAPTDTHMSTFSRHVRSFA